MISFSFADSNERLIEHDLQEKYFLGMQINENKTSIKS
jgi:hypothetical protein